MPKYDDLQLLKSDEYFISIAKQGPHSFMMLGVLKDGSPQLLARVGKTNDIDPSADSAIDMTLKALGQGTLARISDEGISRKEGIKADISYQAYSINYNQVKEYLGLIAAVEKKQLAESNIQQGIINKYRKVYKWEDANEVILDDAAIRAYVPIESSTADEVTFAHKKLSDCTFLTNNELDAQKQTIATKAQQIHVFNTCRNTALNMVEAILGFMTKVSQHFFISPRYQTQLIAGQPDKNSFYILPSPPNVFKDKLSDRQFKILNKLYQRMEEIPLANANTPQTRAKFDALKATYKDIAGTNNLSANELLSKIQEHEEKNKAALFEKRSPNFTEQGLISFIHYRKIVYKNEKRIGSGGE